MRPLAAGYMTMAGLAEYPDLFADEGHGFRKTPDRIRSTVALVQRFEQHLARPASARRE